MAHFSGLTHMLAYRYDSAIENVRTISAFLPRVSSKPSFAGWPRFPTPQGRSHSAHSTPLPDGWISRDITWYYLIQKSNKSDQNWVERAGAIDLWHFLASFASVSVGPWCWAREFSQATQWYCSEARARPPAASPIAPRTPARPGDHRCWRTPSLCKQLSGLMRQMSVFVFSSINIC